ncbi:MAG: aminodeoxychorismate/anthranilate synthase component II [Bacteroidales bacterium]|jgi:anthranilate synthase component 2|nr:aminodeoxychorismate/anthranilate synthase component II [Bacteroidales bacterium]MDD2264816.1 aminodeoxychorismate/anthranilate synthase component II [Bacteroidales bacterium]MDD2832086.1 aminodeoxychorismate/anthranilate synthase component II [Bacteroidales bacterium]MDD3208720.1 aminodeoxychorismate/anthranilate synthase component II [Bacteroidales bacterium]MDD3697283.1 aminodeoxychorismate/anthranilate synthase component II [Bacteroidales bacterium]
MGSILILDNYDSFTYNLVHYVQEYGVHRFEVFRNNEISVDEVDRFDGIILSPGPGIPSEAGNLLPIIQRYSPSRKIFGVCLGQQAIAEAFGGKLLNISKVYHGVATTVWLQPPIHYIFEDVPTKFEAGRYHSWVVDPDRFPPCLKIDALDESGQIMALNHRNLDVCGVQFHPESILTPEGKKIIFNWLRHL